MISFKRDWLEIGRGGEMLRVRSPLTNCFVLTVLACACAGFAQTKQTPAEKAISANSWQWPVIPGCLADPEISTKGKTDFNSPVCPVYELLLTSGVSDIELKSARRLNGEVDGVLYPAFLPGTEVVSFIVSKKFSETFHDERGLVRVSGKAVSARTGSWWTTLETVSEGGHLQDADAIRAKLALTDTPSCIAYADKVQTGVRAYMGVISPAFDEPGGGIEFWFPPNAVVSKKLEKIPGGTGCDAQ
jgi:hypothetical protein